MLLLCILAALAGTPEEDWAALQAAHDDLVDDDLSGDEEADAVLLIQDKPTELAALDDLATTFREQHPNADEAQGSWVLQAKARLYYADLGRRVRPPEDLRKGPRKEYEEVLKTKFHPQFGAVEEKGLEMLRLLVEKEPESDWAREAEKVLRGRE